MCVCMCACVCVHVCMCVCVCVCMYACVCVCMCVCMCTYVCEYMTYSLHSSPLASLRPIVVKRPASATGRHDYHCPLWKIIPTSLLSLPLFSHSLSPLTSSLLSLPLSSLLPPPPPSSLLPPPSSFLYLPLLSQWCVCVLWLPAGTRSL